jgi:hypothetical protein
LTIPTPPASSNLRSRLATRRRAELGLSMGE